MPRAPLSEASGLPLDFNLFSGVTVIDLTASKEEYHLISLPLSPSNDRVIKSLTPEEKEDVL